MPISRNVIKAFGLNLRLLVILLVPCTLFSNQMSIDLGQSVRLELIWVEPGSFTMGFNSLPKNNFPLHEVTITKGFYLGKYEVKQEEYQAVMLNNSNGLTPIPSKWSNNPKRPVEQVSYDDVQVFLRRLNTQQSSNIPDGWAFVLPTESEWEYACRSGLDWAAVSTSPTNNRFAGFSETRDVGQYNPNPWGFYDMFGNVSEWTLDWYGSYTNLEKIDPSGPISGTRRVYRGGNFENNFNIHGGYRGSLVSSERNRRTGFRLVLKGGSTPLLNHLGRRIFVDDDASNGGNGDSWSTAYKFLQDAIATSQIGDEIWVAEGIYKPDQGVGQNWGDRNATFSLKNGVKIIGGFLGNESSGDPLGDANKTILSGEITSNLTGWSENVVSAIDLDSNITKLSNLKIIRGYARNDSQGSSLYVGGGGIKIINSTLELDKCIFSENKAHSMGGGLYSIDSDINLNNCLFVNNSANRGGGIHCRSSSLRIVSTVFNNNQAGVYGGGAQIWSPKKLSINKCKFNSNFSGAMGGGILLTLGVQQEKFTITNCIFNGNLAKSGGAVRMSANSDFEIFGCIFYGNRAEHSVNSSSQWGGAIYYGEGSRS